MVPIGFRVSFSCMIAVMEAVVVEEHEWSAPQVHKTKSLYKLMRRESEAIIQGAARLIDTTVRTMGVLGIEAIDGLMDVKLSIRDQFALPC